MGTVTIFLRQSHVVDAVEAIVHRKASKQKKLQESARLQAGRVENFDIASETVLAQTVNELQTQILVTRPQFPNLCTTTPSLSLSPVPILSLTEAQRMRC